MGQATQIATVTPSVPGELLSQTSSKRVTIFGILTILVPVVVWFAPLGLDPTIHRTLAVTSFLVTSWMTSVFDHTMTGFFGCFLYWVFGLVRFQTAFSGFAEETPWFIYGGMLIGAMVTKSGLARRIAYVVMKQFGSRYSRLLFGLIVANYLLTFVVPSAIARVVIMAAIALGLVEVFGVQRGSNIGRALFITFTLTGGIFDKMIIAGAASITAHGLIQQFSGVPLTYSRWFIAFLPCGVITIIAIWRFVLWLYPPEKEAVPGGANVFQTELDKMGRWSPAEKRAFLLVVVALALWLSDFWHHMSPAKVGLGIGLLAVAPKIGVLDVEDVKKINPLPMFFVALVASMGQVLVATKTLDLLTNVMFNWLTHMLSGTIVSTVVLYWTAFVYHFFLASEISMLATSIPLFIQFASAHGMDPIAIGLVWTFAAAGKIFIYQSGLTIFGYSYGFFGAWDVFRVGLFLTVLEFLLLILIVGFYWPLIGIG